MSGGERSLALRNSWLGECTEVSPFKSQSGIGGFG